MLFTKKKRFEITNSQIKEELSAKDGTVVLKLNLKYPQIQCPKGDKLNVYAIPLYKKIALGLVQHAKGEIYKKALDSYNSEATDFLPFSVVMNWENTFINEKYISILLDISLGDNNGVSSQKQTQVWDRKTGLKCNIGDFLSSDTVKRTKKDLKATKESAFFHKELFVLREGAIEFFLMEKGNYIPFSIPFEISQNGCFA